MADQTDDSTIAPADEGLDPAALPEGGAPAAGQPAEDLLQEEGRGGRSGTVKARGITATGPGQARRSRSA